MRSFEKSYLVKFWKIHDIWRQNTSRFHCCSLLRKIKNTVTTPFFFSFSDSYSCRYWLVEYARAGEQLVHVVLWRQAYSPRIAYVGVNLGGDVLSKSCMTQSWWWAGLGAFSPAVGDWKQMGWRAKFESGGIHLILFSFSHVKLAMFSCSGCFFSKARLLSMPLFSTLTLFSPLIALSVQCNSSSFLTACTFLSWGTLW